MCPIPYIRTRIIFRVSYRVKLSHYHYTSYHVICLHQQSSSGSLPKAAKLAIAALSRLWLDASTRSVYALQLALCYPSWIVLCANLAKLALSVQLGVLFQVGALGLEYVGVDVCTGQGDRCCASNT